MAYQFGDGIKNLLLAGLGAAATTLEKSQELIEQMTRRGELTVEQGKVLNEELKHRAHAFKEEAKAKVKTAHAESAAEAAAEATAEEAESMNEVEAAVGKVLAHFEELSEADRRLLREKLYPAEMREIEAVDP
ncbi:MAG: hypothetical protein EOM03_13405 [Clostridia bacterium]|nr:hypothetical protein [Clostridia bacterium]